MQSLASRGSRFPISAAPREKARAAVPMTTTTSTARRRRLARSSPSASASASASAAPGPSGRHHATLDSINNATKWTVSAATALVLFRNRADAATRFAVVGSVVAAFLTKVLKKVINEARPSEARKADPGMPSSHAQSLAFLSTSAARAILFSARNGGGEEALTGRFFSFLVLPVPTVAAAALVLTTAVLLATLRVTLGYHTWPQVVAGGVLGCALALGWAELGARVVVPLCSGGAKSGSTAAAAAASAAASAALACATGLAVALFAFVTVRSWWREENEKLRERRS